MKVKRIYLIGFRGTGKSTTGKVLAEKLNWSYMDMDFAITEEAGKPANEITKEGVDWKEFRRIEQEVLGELSLVSNIVISCGGGVGVNDISGKENAEILKNNKDSFIVLLKASDETIRERLARQFKNKKIMPFLNSDNAKSKDETFEDLVKRQVNDSMDEYQKRKPLYDILTDCKIETGDKTPEEIAREIMKYVN